MKRSIVVWGFFLIFGHFFSSAQAILDTKLANMTDSEQRAVFIKLFSDADISTAKNIKGKENKTQYVFDIKTKTSQKSQEKVLLYLQSESVPHRSFYIVNGVAATLTKNQVKHLLTLPEVESIMEDGIFVKAEVETLKSDERTTEWGVSKINARQVWSLGFKGQNVVIGGQDTGYKWDHVQLQNKYRGWNGTSASHNYHWHDAIYQNNPMNSGNNPCGYNLSVPCDDNNHGTHTMGTMVGNHNTDTIGVAPDAKWIGCRNMERGYGSLTTYVECFEWFLAPYAYGDLPANGDPTKMPHVINNSWGCPSIEGCNALNVNVMEEALMTLRLAGCVIVVSNGNSGSGCATTYDPPAFFEGSFSVGATNSSNGIAGFSSRGPVTFDNSSRLKPNVSAPGVGVRSSIANGGYATYNGTSMAGPHVAGAVALIISANPDLAGEVDQIEDILEQTTLPLTGGNVCGGIPTTAIPNNTFGYGLIDVQKAVARARNDLFVPLIKVDQFGYRTGDKKVAILSNPVTGYNQADSFSPVGSISLKNSSTHAVVFSAAPISWNSGNTHSQSGDQVWWFDFSGYTTPGKYYVSNGAIRSEDFIIHDTVYQDVLKTAFKTFYFQRCGIAKLAPYAMTGFVDGLCHAQDVTCKWYANPALSSRWKDLSGGWHDAGDYNKYVNFAYAAVFDLLMSFHLHQQAWVSDNMNIPESCNGIPDLLDEIKYETDWLLKMQESDGGVLSVVGVANFATASPPSADNADRLYGPKTTSASYSAAAMFAFAATQFRKIDHSIAQNYSTTLQTAAINAYNWAVNNPGVLFYNAGVLAAGEQEIDVYETNMRRMCAAVFLYELTNDVNYKNYVESNYTQSHLKQWNFVYPFENPTQLTLLYYTFLHGVTSSVASDIRNTFKNSMENSSDNIPAHVNQLDAYRSYLTTGNHVWGSNRVKTNMGNLFAAYKDFGLNGANNTLIDGITQDYLGYIHGRNPVGLCFLSNMEHMEASKSVNSVYHAWFADGSNLWDDVRSSVYGPAPGFVSGGVNPNYNLDGCCSTNSCGSSNSMCISLEPPRLQPVLKSYRDWNTGWPQNSWEITEPAIYYQSSYLFLLAGKVNQSTLREQINTKVTQVLGDIQVSSVPYGLILTSSNGTFYRLTVNNSGTINIQTQPVPPTVVSKIETGDLLIVENQKGFIMRSTNNNLWKVYVNKQGGLSTENIILIPSVKTEIQGSDLMIMQPQHGFIAGDEDGICYKISVSDSGHILSTVISCE